MEAAAQLEPQEHNLTYILLSESASRRLALEGNAFAVVTRTACPQYRDRMIIAVQALVPEVAAGLVAILRGSHHAVPNRPPKPPKSPPPANVPEAAPDAAAAATAAAIGKRGAYARRELTDTPARERAEVARDCDVRELAGFNAAVDSWLTAHGCDTTASSWAIDSDPNLTNHNHDSD